MTDDFFHCRNLQSTNYAGWFPTRNAFFGSGPLRFDRLKVRKRWCGSSREGSSGIWTRSKEHGRLAFSQKRKGDKTRVEEMLISQWKVRRLAYYPVAPKRPGCHSKSRKRYGRAGSQWWTAASREETSTMDPTPWYSMRQRFTVRHPTGQVTREKGSYSICGELADFRNVGEE